jgi:dTMP kinase
MSQARFISFEGLDGSGKTTQIAATIAYLQQHGVPCLSVREPGSTALGGATRRILKQPEATYKALNAAFARDPDFEPLAVDEQRTAEAELYLFLAARAEFCTKVVAPALQQGKTVITDRFMDSTLAYQGGGLYQHDPDVMRLLDQNHSLILRRAGIHKPDLTVLLDITPRVMRSRASGRVLDFIEQRGDLYFGRVRAAYLDIARKEPDRVLLLDGLQDREAIFNQGIRPRLDSLYGLGKTT